MTEQWTRTNRSHAKSRPSPVKRQTPIILVLDCLGHCGGRGRGRRRCKWRPGPEIENKCARRGIRGGRRADSSNMEGDGSLDQPTRCFLGENCRRRTRGRTTRRETQGTHGPATLLVLAHMRGTSMNEAVRQKACHLADINDTDTTRGACRGVVVHVPLHQAPLLAVDVSNEVDADLPTHVPDMRLESNERGAARTTSHGSVRRGRHNKAKSPCDRTGASS